MIRLGIILHLSTPPNHYVADGQYQDFQRNVDPEKMELLRSWILDLQQARVYELPPGWRTANSRYPTVNFV